MSDTTARALAFGPFRLEPDDRLLAGGTPVHLPPKEVAVLRLLAEAEGRVVRKEDLFARVWPGVSVSDASLTRCIRSIRAALGERGRRGSFLETVHGRGYRFAAPVEILDAQATAARVGRLLVAPLVNERGKPDDEYLCDGLSEELIDELGRLLAGHLGVIARHTALRLKDRIAAAAAQDLGVEFVAAGSLERRDDLIRVRVELIRRQDGVQLWSGRFERRAEGVASLAREIAAIVADRLRPGPPREAPVVAPAPPVDAATVRAHNAVLEGRFLANLRTEDGIRSALVRFRRAAADDPGYAPAHVGIAQAHLMLAFRGFIRPLAAAPIVRSALDEAFAIDPDSPAALSAEGQLQLQIEWKPTVAERTLRRALALEPGYPPACMHLGDLLSTRRAWDEAVAVRRLGLELDPLAPSLRLGLAQTLLWAGRSAESLEVGRALTRDEPGFLVGFAVQACAAYQQGRRDEAIAAAEAGLRLTPSEPLGASGCAWALAACGRRASARAVADALARGARERPGAAIFVAIAFMGLEEDELALEWLERAFAERSMFLPLFASDPRRTRLLDHPRAREIIAAAAGDAV